MQNSLPKPPKFSPKYRAYLAECGRAGMKKRWELPEDPEERRKELEKRKELGQFLNRKKREKALKKLEQPGRAIAM